MVMLTPSSLQIIKCFWRSFALITPLKMFFQVLQVFKKQGIQFGLLWLTIWPFSTFDVVLASKRAKYFQNLRKNYYYFKKVKWFNNQFFIEKF